ncbi:MAG: hypothetical protein SGJ09_03045, partial [Phycisphaerae bacterium]|nr:hypothetical protein [Phycisphaerae bacterium]
MTAIAAATIVAASAMPPGRDCGASRAKSGEREASRAPQAPDLVGPFPVDRQAALGRHLAERMGFDFTRGRLD